MQYAVIMVVEGKWLTKCLWCCFTIEFLIISPYLYMVLFYYWIPHHFTILSSPGTLKYLLLTTQLTWCFLFYAAPRRCTSDDLGQLVLTVLRICLNERVDMVLPKPQSLPPGKWDRMCFAVPLQNLPPLHGYESLSEHCCSNDAGVLVLYYPYPLKKNTVV